MAFEEGSLLEVLCSPSRGYGYHRWNPAVAVRTGRKRITATVLLREGTLRVGSYAPEHVRTDAAASRLHTLLDRDPFQAGHRKELAALYARVGREDIAQGLLALAAAGKAPKLGSDGKWRWELWSSPASADLWGGPVARDGFALLADSAGSGIGRASWVYPTRWEAEKAVCAALWAYRMKKTAQEAV